MFTISRSVRLTKSQDGGVLLDVEHGAIFSLNPVGTRIVELLEDGHSVPSLVHQISREFNTSKEIVKGDIDEFLSRLRQQRLLIEQATGDQAEQGEI